MSHTISFIDAPDAANLLRDPGFRADWEALYRACPWATEYQSPAFLATWFDVFHERFAPVCIEGRESSGRLTGLLWLARDRRKAQFVCAGHAQAEYHGWLARPDTQARFADSAFAAYCARPDATPLVFSLVLQELPLDWSRGTGRWPSLVLHEQQIRPLIDTDPETWPKGEGKRDKGKLNRLKKQGKLEFLRLRTAAELESYWPAMAEQYDKRIADVVGLDSFVRNPVYGAFFFECMRRVAGLAEGFALTLDGAPVAAIVGQRCGESLVLGVSTYDDRFAAQSPSRLLVPMVAQAIRGDGYRYFDLGPYGGWKIAMATKTEPVTTLTVHPTYASALLAQARRGARRLAKLGLARIGLDYRQLKQQVLRRRRASQS